MAAIGSFESFNASLSQHDRELMKEFIAEQRVELLAARSEDARTRIVYDYIQQARELLRQGMRNSRH